MLHKTGPKRSAADFIIFRGGSKGPGALFWFIVFSLLTTNSSVMYGRQVGTVKLNLRKRS